MINFYKIIISLSLSINIHAISLESVESSIFPKYFKSNIYLDVMRSGELKHYEMDINVYYEKSLISFNKPQDRLKILKNKTKYWMYFTNSKRIVATSGHSIFSNSDFAYNDILDYSLSKYYKIENKKNDFFLLKASSKKSPYYFVRMFLDDKNKINKLEFLAKNKEIIKVMYILQRQNGYASKILMKKEFTSDFQSILYINFLQKEKTKLWKFNLNYLKHL
jgi:hypothetical protein